MLLVVSADMFGHNAQSQLHLDLTSFLKTTEILREVYFLLVLISTFYMFI